MIVVFKSGFDKVKEKHGSVIVTKDDVLSALRFTYDLMLAETDCLKRSEPNATRTIRETEAAADKVLSLLNDIANERFVEEKSTDPYSYAVWRKASNDMIVQMARRAYAKNHAENKKYTKTDALVHILEETGYNLTAEERAEVESRI